jgi:protein translocase SecG subunit
MHILQIIQVVISILLVVAILFQNKEGGLGVVGGSIGGGNYQTKRGFEKFLTQSTVVLGILFIVVSLLVNLV